MPIPDRDRQQIYPYVTMERLLVTLAYRLATHPFIQNCPIRDENGNPYPLSAIRLYDGFDVSNLGLSLSLYPYKFSNDDRTALTTESQNASIVYKPHTFSGMDQHGQQTNLDIAEATIVLKVQLRGVARAVEPDSVSISGKPLRIETDLNEALVRRYTEMLRAVLRSNDMCRLPSYFPVDAKGRRPNLVKNSFPTLINYPTSRWDTKENFVFHTAIIHWKVWYFVPCQWQVPATYEFFPEDVDGNLIVGTYEVTPGVFVDVVYDSFRGVTFDANTLLAIDPDTLIDPGTGQAYTGLDAVLVNLIRGAPLPTGTTAINIFLKKTGNQWET